MGIYCAAGLRRRRARSGRSTCLDGGMHAAWARQQARHVLRRNPGISMEAPHRWSGLLLQHGQGQQPSITHRAREGGSDSVPSLWCIHPSTCAGTQAGPGRLADSRFCLSATRSWIVRPAQAAKRLDTDCIWRLGRRWVDSERVTSSPPSSLLCCNTNSPTPSSKAR